MIRDLLRQPWIGISTVPNAKEASAFVSRVVENPINAILLERLPSLNLPDCWLVAGCLFQTAWNVHTGRLPKEGIRDYDIFYCDPSDLSYEAEDREIKRLSSAFSDVNAIMELKNQARVHLWYKERFGHTYPPLETSTDGIDHFLIRCTCIGIGCSPGHQRQLYTTYGLEELYAGVLRPNPRNALESRFQQKAESYKARWPWLRIETGDALSGH